MDEPTLPLPGLSPVSGKRLDVRFDGGLLSSDGGILLLREVEQRLGVADRLAACIKDPRSPEHITHSLADIIGFRLMMIAAGYEDGNDASSLRIDPMFKMALDLTPSDHALCSQPTISRLENLPDMLALLRMGRAMVDLYCESFRTVPKRIVLDIDDTFDAVHGGHAFSHPQDAGLNAGRACPSSGRSVSLPVSVRPRSCCQVDGPSRSGGLAQCPFALRKESALVMHPAPDAESSPNGRRPLPLTKSHFLQKKIKRNSSTF